MILCDLPRVAGSESYKTCTIYEYRTGFLGVGCVPQFTNSAQRLVTVDLYDQEDLQ